MNIGAPGRKDNISDKALRCFQKTYKDVSISKDDIFFYIYGVLHASDFRERYASSLDKDLPRIPFAPSFQPFAEAGRQLAELHLNYETGPRHPLNVGIASGKDPKSENFHLGTKRMKIIADGKALQITPTVILNSIPPEAHAYVVNGRSPLGWFCDRYRFKKDEPTGIPNDPNDWWESSEDIVPAIERIVHVSVETVRIVKSLPPSLPGRTNGATGTTKRKNSGRTKRRACG